MYARTVEDDEIIRKNNCDVRPLYPWEGVVVPPWNSTLCTVRPLESSKEHAHDTDETFIFTGGWGRVRIGDEQRPIKVGDVIYVPHDTMHIVTNSSDTEPLTFVSIYWLQDPPKQDPLRQDPLRQDPLRQDPPKQDPQKGAAADA